MERAIPQSSQTKRLIVSPLTRLRRARYQDRSIEWEAYLFVIPFFAIFFILQVAPILFGVYVSFTDWSITKPPEWVGFANFQRLLQDDWVVQVWGNTLQMAAMIVPGVMITALLTALYVNRRLWLSGLVRTFFFAPHVVAVTATALIWIWILEKETGVLNLFLHQIGLPKIGWITTTTWVKPSIAMVSIWWAAGYHMVILLAGLQEVPDELREAARVDGASNWQTFWKITLPLLRPALILVITLEIIAALRIFGQVFLMTNGGPGGKSATIVSYIYSSGFTRYQLGYAAALSLLLFATIIFFTWLRMKFFTELEY